MWHAYPLPSEYLCANDKMSDARPLPSQTTIGRGGCSRRHSKTMDITLGPPSTIKPTTGTPCPSPVEQTKRVVRCEGTVIEIYKLQIIKKFRLSQWHKCRKDLQVSNQVSIGIKAELSPINSIGL